MKFVLFSDQTKEKSTAKVSKARKPPPPKDPDSSSSTSSAATGAQLLAEENKNTVKRSPKDKNKDGTKIEDSNQESEETIEETKTKTKSTKPKIIKSTKKKTDSDNSSSTDGSYEKTLIEPASSSRTKSKITKSKAKSASDDSSTSGSKEDMSEDTGAKSKKVKSSTGAVKKIPLSTPSVSKHGTSKRLPDDKTTNVPEQPKISISESGTYDNSKSPDLQSGEKTKSSLESSDAEEEGEDDEGLLGQRVSFQRQQLLPNLLDKVKEYCFKETCFSRFSKVFKSMHGILYKPANQTQGLNMHRFILHQN